MQKRLLALVATVAMVLSMFTGIAFAAATPKLALSTYKVISSAPHMEYQLVSGAITGVAALPEGTVHVVDVEGTEKGPIYSSIEVKNGSFSFYLPTNLDPQDVAVKVYTYDVGAETKGADPVVENVIEVRYNVATTPTKLEFAYSDQQSPTAITGKVTNSKGEPVKDAKVALYGVAKDELDTDYEYFVVEKTTATGEFGWVLLKWDEVEDLALEVKGYVHAEGKVAPVGATLTVTPNTGVVHSIAEVEFEVKGSGFGTGTVTFKLQKGTDDPVTGITWPAPTTSSFTNKFKWTPGAPGTYKLTATQGNYSASATIVVTNPVSYNLINGSKLEELKVGSNVFTFGYDELEAGNIYLAQYKLVDSVPTVVTSGFDYKVFVDGKEVAQEAGVVDIKADKLGTKTIKVEVRDGETKVFEKTFTAKVVGWDIAVNPTELTVNQAQDVVVVIKDEKGAPINNAKLTLTGQSAILPGSANVQNGTYTFKNVKYAAPGTKDLQVLKVTASGEQVMANLALEVIGQQVYDVTADVDALLQGKGQEVKLTVTRDGVAVMAQRIKWIYADGKSTEADEAYPTYVGDGVNKATIKATKAGKLTVRAMNFDGTLVGETTINVVAPQLVLVDEDAVNVTENFKSNVNFKVVDPRDGSAIKSNLAVSGKYADIAVYDANGGIVGEGAADEVVTILGDDEYALTILATNAGYKAAEDAEKVVAVQLKVNETLLDAHFEVKKATITSDPGMIVIGAQNNLTLTYEDANGKPIAGKDVVVVGTPEIKLGKTNEDGQVIYPVGIVAAAVEVKAETDVTLPAKLFVTKTIKIGYDAEAPKVTYEANGDKAVLIVTDNVRLVRVNIGGKDVDFWPGAKYEHKVTLKPGINKFAVKAQDSNDNVLDEVVEIEYKTDAVVLKGEQVKRQGEFVFVQLRQFEEIGAQVGWKQDTQTATFIVGDTKVEVTIGSLTAKVNGKAVTMPAAPFIDKATSRTYVPTRFIAEALNWNVHWAAGDVITITLP